MTEIVVKCPKCGKDITIAIRTIDSLKKRIQDLETQLKKAEEGSIFSDLLGLKK